MTSAAGVQDMSDVLFYHLERQPLERVLPQLLEKSGERGWRAVVQATSPERLAALDTLLWTYRDDSFLAHGTAGDGGGADQPVYLTCEDDNPNGADVRFLVDGADCTDLASYKRVVFMFDGHDEAAVTRAREQWKRAYGKGCAVTYWQQNDRGQWENRGKHNE